MIKVVGAKGKIKDVDDFLEKISIFAKKNNLIIQILTVFCNSFYQVDVIWIISQFPLYFFIQCIYWDSNYIDKASEFFQPFHCQAYAICVQFCRNISIF